MLARARNHDRIVALLPRCWCKHDVVILLRYATIQDLVIWVHSLKVGIRVNEISPLDEQLSPCVYPCEGKNDGQSHNLNKNHPEPTFIAIVWSVILLSLPLNHGIPESTQFPARRLISMYALRLSLVSLLSRMRGDERPGRHNSQSNSDASESVAHSYPYSK